MTVYGIFRKANSSFIIYVRNDDIVERNAEMMMIFYINLSKKKSR